jgi:hypothetical protein
VGCSVLFCFCVGVGVGVLGWCGGLLLCVALRPPLWPWGWGGSTTGATVCKSTHASLPYSKSASNDWNINHQKPLLLHCPSSASSTITPSHHHPSLLPSKAAPPSTQPPLTNSRPQLLTLLHHQSDVLVIDYVNKDIGHVRQAVAHDAGLHVRGLGVMILLKGSSWDTWWLQ